MLPTQKWVQEEESTNCWYAHLRRSGKCCEHIDFADHLVLAVCQYYAIQVRGYRAAAAFITVPKPLSIVAY